MNPKGKAKKRLLFLIAMAIALLVAAVPTPAWAAGPTDISGHWAQERIAACAGQDLIKGYPDGTFRPDRSITRAEFMVLVNRSFGYSHGSGRAFKDVPAGSWFAGEVAKAVAAGYAGGYPDGTVRPNNPITRAEAAAMIARIKDLAPDTAAAGKFADAAGIPAWSKGAIGAAVGRGIMGGYPDGSFRADSPITRAEAVTALTKALAVVYDKAGTYGPVAGTATVIGDITVKTRDVTLQNTLVLGDLIVDKAVGDGNVTLKNVTVRGSTYVYGGGVNSVYFLDAKTGKVYVARDDGPVRIVVTGSTEIKDLSLSSDVKVEEADLTGKGIVGITVEKKAGGAIQIELKGVKAESLDIKTPGITIKADGRTDVQKLTVKADNVTVQTEKGTNITTLVADGKVSVTGQGTIEKAEVKVNGVSFETKPISQDVANGATPPTTGSATAGGGDGGSSNGGSSGGEGGLTVTATAITDANVSIACGSIDYDYDFAVNGQPVTYAQALQAPYYLDPDTSTVTLSDGTNRSNAVTISSLGLDNDGRKSYSGTQEMNSDFVINGAWFPTQVNIVLKSKTSLDGKSVTNPWEKTFTIDINEDLEVFKINADAEYVFLRDTQLNPVGDIVTGDLRLIAAGQMNSVITWQSSDPCIQIGNISNGFYPAAVTRDDRQQKTVTLTATLTLGSQSLTKAFTVTVPAKETLLVSASDASIPLNGDYKTPQAIKNYWLLMIANSNPAITVKDNISTAAVTVAQDAPLPNGFTYSVAKNGPREIKITLEGEASALVTGSTEVGFIVSPEAVIEPGFKESGPVTVYINPPGTGGPKISVDTGNSDLRLKMQDGNIHPDPADNSWVLKISEPQIKEGVSMGDINITNLPDGLGVQTVTLDQQINSITINIGGTASEPLVSPVNVGIVVKAGAANDTGYEDSEQITAVIEPYSLTDEQKVAADKAALTADIIKGGNADFNNVTTDLNLVTSIIGGAGCTITWASDNDSVVATDGTVTRPAYGSGDATVTLTATITSGSASDNKEFTVTVKQEERLTVAAVTNDSDNNTNIDAAKDSSGNIHLVYLKSGNAYYRKYTAGQGWGTEEQIDNSVLQAAIAADSAGNPHIAYVNSSGAINYIARESGSWSSPQTVWSSGGANVDLDIGPSGTVHFAFEGNPIAAADGYADIGYRTYSNGTFSVTEILFNGFYWYDGGGKTGRYYSSPCIKVDSSDNYHVVVRHHALDGAIGWTDHNYYLIYKSDAGAGLEIGSESNGNTEMGMSNNPITLTGSGAAIVYTDSSGKVNVARPAGSAWNKTQMVSGSGASTDVALPWNLKIIYTESGNLYYVEEGKPGEQIDSGIAGGVGYPVVLDTGARAYVLYVKSDGSDNEVYCATIAG